MFNVFHILLNVVSIGQELARQRTNIKEDLIYATQALGPVMSVVPGGEPIREKVDQMLAKLEAMSPTDKPLNTQVKSL